MSNTLLPCPFCGGEVKLMAIAGEPYPPTYEVDLSKVDEQSDDICFVHCPKCKADWNIELRIDSFPLDTIAAWNRRTQPENEPLTETERAVAGMIENECMRENLTALCKSYGVTEADFFGFLYRNTPAPGKEE